MTVSQNTRDRAPWEIAFGNNPKDSSAVMPIIVNFSSGTSQDVDLSQEIMKNALDFVQCLFIDNSKNSAALTILQRNTGLQYTLQAGYQAIIPALCPAQNPFFTFTTATASFLLPVGFINCPMPCLVWPAGVSGNAVFVNGSTGLDHSANKPALLANLLATAPVNLLRNNVEYQNQSGNLHQVVLDDGAGNNVSIINLSGGTGANTQGSEWADPSFKGRVRIFATLAADQVMLRET